MAPFIVKGGGQFLEENVAVWHEGGDNVHSDTHLQETENIFNIIMEISNNWKLHCKCTTNN